MQENANVRVVRRIYENLEFGCVDAILDAVSQDVEWEYPSIAGVPFSGVWRGREGVRDFFQALDRARELLDFKPDRFIAEGDTVIALGRFTLRANATGWDAASQWAHVWDMEGGKVARFMAYVDTAAVCRAHAGQRRPLLEERP